MKPFCVNYSEMARRRSSWLAEPRSCCIEPMPSNGLSTWAKKSMWIAPPFGGCVSAIARGDWRRPCTMRRAPAGRVFFSTRQRQRIEDLACQAPASIDWDMTHWSHRTLAQAVVEEEYVETIHHTTVGTILRDADLYPHRFRYWKTTVWDDAAVERALKILWYYERMESLWQRGEVILCTDEKPNLQVLERARPTQRLQPGQIERQEFEYKRHGTVIVLAGLTIYNGRMWAECLDKNDGKHFRPAIRRFLHPYAWAKRIHLVIDNWSSHVSDDTTAFYRDLSPRVHVLFTPVDASWLNQAESLLEAFTERYLLRGSWNSRDLMIQHILDSEIE